MLAGKVVATSIEKSLNRIKKQHLSEFMFNMNASEAQIQSILAFRDICLKYNKKKQKKYFRVWVTNKLKPMQIIKINAELTNFMARNEFLRVFLNKWNL